VKRGWQVRAGIAFAAAIGVALLLVQACGGGSTGEDVTPTATNSPTSTADRGAPGIGDITPGAGPSGQALFIGGASEEFAAFLGISLEQLESELGAEGATPASVAEAHGRTREELKTFFIEQLQANFDEAVAAGTMSQEAADDMFESTASRIDDIIDGEMPLSYGGPPSSGDMTPGAQGQGPFVQGQALFIGGASEEFAAFLGISLEQLESELGAEGATPASVAEAHGRTREELKTFFIEQLQANLDEAVAAGTMSQEEADDMFERQASRIDDIIDGEMASGRPWPAPDGQ
jgi:polyhydroxyalkanoate synthesis regulator phasin